MAEETEEPAPQDKARLVAILTDNTLMPHFPETSATGVRNVESHRADSRRNSNVEFEDSRSE